MALRMTGLASGIDTEAVVEELMYAHNLKKEKVEKAKTKLEWKQEKWADLNTKLVKLYNEQVSKMYLESSYMTKKTSVSDASKVSVTANANAATGNYTLQINSIATSQYLTGGKIDVDDTSTKLVDIDSSLLNKEITISYGEKTVNFEVTEDSTIANFVTALKNAGLNANYDTEQKRFFISSKESGKENAFSITTSVMSAEEVDARTALRDAVGYDNMTSARKKVIDEAIETLQGVEVDSEEYNTALQTIAETAYESQKANTEAAAKNYVRATIYAENYAEKEAEAKESLKDTYYNEDGTLKTGKTEEAYLEAVAKEADSKTTKLVEEEIVKSERKLQIEEAAFTGKTVDDINALGETAVNRYYKDGVEGFTGMEGVDAESIKADIADEVSAYVALDDSQRSGSAGESALSSLGLMDITKNADGTVSTVGTTPDGFVMIKGSDSEIVLNGATLTSSSSVVSANGLDINLTGLTKADEEITFSVTNDIDGVYDSIKSFLKEYNTIMKEMYTLYSADSASGYDVLSSEEKEAMTDEDVKLWEDKIKGSLLRNDSTLGSLINGMRSAMMSTVNYDGKSYALSSFGIMTSTDYTEGGLLHIYGDTEDAVYGDKEDKLKAALADDPEAVIATLTEIFGNLKDTMANKMSTTKYSSALTFYEDIKIKDDLKDYEDEIEDWEDRLAEMEDNYYAKFAAMETAMAELQSKQSSLAGLLGG